MKITYFKYKDVKLKILTENKQIKEIEFSDKFIETNEDDFSKKLKKNLLDYFEGRSKEFNFELCIEGTEFQKKVWSEMVKIPYGETISYGELAQRVGCPKGARAVGMACNKNKIPIIIPCHRVVGKNGKLTGFAGGLQTKEFLLKIEGEKNQC